MLRRSEFTVDAERSMHNEVDQDMRRTIILEKSEYEPQPPDQKVNILIALVVILSILVGCLAMHVSKLSSRIQSLEDNDPFKKCWVFGPTGKM
jgi:capsular polysaccharide biosynthesis protein